jgi:hypothetical protein
MSASAFVSRVGIGDLAGRVLHDIAAGILSADQGEGKRRGIKSGLTAATWKGPDTSLKHPRALAGRRADQPGRYAGGKTVRGNSGRS